MTCVAFKPTVIGAAAVLYWGIMGLFGSPGVADADMSGDIGKQFDADKRQLSLQWRQLEAGQHADWQRFQRKVASKWNTVVSSTHKQWVAYDQDFNTRSTVDFEKGAITIETVVEPDMEGDAHAARQNILSKVRSIFEQQDVDSQRVLADQVQDRQGRTIDLDHVEAFFRQDILPVIRMDPDPYVSTDGRTRQRYHVGISMVPEHLEVRASKYRDMVLLNAQRFRLPPELLMAVIHTESYFNPLAESGAGAIGLMQLIPRHGARDAYRFLYQNDWVIRPEYLYAPGINIELGAAYLYLLENRYFQEVPDPVVRRYLSICAYNWGPTAVRKRIVDHFTITGFDQQQVYALLREHTPKETSDYLARVIQRVGLYQGYFDS